MKDLKKILEMMKVYEIKPENYAEFCITEETFAERKLLPKFNFDNYHELTNEIKQEFKIEKNYKINKYGILKSSLLFFLYLICYFKGLIKNESEKTWFYENYLFAFLAGILWLNFGFSTLHDASHYGFFSNRKKISIDDYDKEKNLFNFIPELLAELFSYTLAIGEEGKLKKTSINKANEDQNNLIKKQNNNENQNEPNLNNNNNNKKIIFGFLQKSENTLNNKNDILNSLWQGWALWNSYIWFKHHTYAHHSFTGIFGLDPDLIHLLPLARKTRYKTYIIKSLIAIQQKTIWLILIFLPGLYLGQVINYFICAFKGSFLKVSIPQVFRKTPFLELLLYLSSALLLIFNNNYICVYFYFIGLNLMYAICIVPDHDTFESAIENEKQTDDWCEMQIRKSGNFCEQSFFMTDLCGGINYQIQHHLFPTIAHCHYKRIAGRVKEFCLRKGFPYVSKNSLAEVYDSYMKTIAYAAVDEAEQKEM
jgi:fatty acid desaturase